MSEKIRAEFEAWAKSEQISIGVFAEDGQNDGEYYFLEAHWAWKAWQASRAALVVELPGAIWCPLAYHEAINDVKEALDDAGVDYI